MRIKCLLILLTGVLISGDLVSQKENEYANFWVEFTDKDSTQYSIHQPEGFLSKRAIERRQKYGIPITAEDFPVNHAYLHALRRLGANILHTSRWINAATLSFPVNEADQLEELPFISKVEYAAKIINRQSSGSPAFRYKLESEVLPEMPYGYSTLQIQQINGDSLHALGYRGKGVMIAVLDGGFKSADSIPFFDSLRSANRLIFHHDFVDQDSFVFESSSHGSQVLSTMASNIPGLLVGTAPEATYVCVKTEDTRGEYRIEECNWVAGIEYADSIGADVVNSSLGYTTFNDKKMNYSYESLNGETSMSSKAATIAVSKGMIVVSSAGNSGNSKWKYLGIPADGKNVLTVGAANQAGEKAGFSSVGPTADGRIKPDVAALGTWVAVSSTNAFRVDIASGTSVSSPLIAGMVACLWQAFPEKTNLEIIEAVKMSGHQSDSPDNELGYGVPDFLKSYRILAEDSARERE